MFFALWSFLSGTEKVTAVTAPSCLVIFSSNFSSSCRSRQFKTTCLGFKSKFETVFELFAIKAYFCVSFVLSAWVQLVVVTQSTWPMQCIEFLSPPSLPLAYQLGGGWLRNSRECSSHLAVRQKHLFFTLNLKYFTVKIFAWFFRHWTQFSLLIMALFFVFWNSIRKQR